jgi:hypothetical protein
MYVLICSAEWANLADFVLPNSLIADRIWLFGSNKYVKVPHHFDWQRWQNWQPWQNWWNRQILYFKITFFQTKFSNFELPN